MQKLLKDDSGQMSGTAMLVILLIACIFIMGVTWIVFSYLGVNPIITFFDVCVGQGWVTDQSYTGFVILVLIWTALPALVIIGYLIGTQVKASVVKNVR
jgi:heme/copper-type cytochrome/quinol oxidase subunit 4